MNSPSPSSSVWAFGMFDANSRFSLVCWTSRHTCLSFNWPTASFSWSILWNWTIASPKRSIIWRTIERKSKRWSVFILFIHSPLPISIRHIPMLLTTGHHDTYGDWCKFHGQVVLTNVTCEGNGNPMSNWGYPKVCSAKWTENLLCFLELGAEFIRPELESSNHFSSVFVYHLGSRTLHVDDTIIFSNRTHLLLKLFGFRNGTMSFHPSIKTVGLHPTAEAPYLFRDWMCEIVRNWPFENLCCTHMGVKKGGAHVDVQVLLNKIARLFA